MRNRVRMGTGSSMVSMAIALVLIVSMAAKAADLPQADNGQLARYQAREALYDALHDFAEEPSDSHKEICEQRIDALLTVTISPDVRDYYIAAKTAELVGLEEKAISILHQALEHQPGQNMLGMNVPLEFGAHLWIGRLHRDAGRAQDALDAFQRAISAAQEEDLPMAVIPRLYAADVQGRLLNDADGAAAMAQAMLQEASDLDDYSRPVMEAWARRLYQEFSEGTSDIVCPREPGLEMLGITISLVNGIMIDEPDLSGHKYSPAWSLYLQHMERIARNSRSMIDRQVAALVAADILRRDTQEFSRAEELFAQIFASDEFLAPAAGFYLVACLERQEDTKRALEVLDEIAERWPDTEWVAHANSKRRELAREDQAQAPTAEGQLPEASRSPEQAPPALNEDRGTGVDWEESPREPLQQGPPDETGSFGAMWAGIAVLTCIITIGVIFGFLSFTRRARP